jgi:hypothetical protein
MKRFLVLALVGALGLAGGTGSVFGQNGGPNPHPKPQATKAHPPAAPGKRPPKKSPPQAKKAPSQAKRASAKGSKPPSRRNVGVGMPKRGQRPLTHKDPAGPGNGSKPGAGSYSWDEYVKDLGTAGQEELDGVLEELPADAEIVGGAIAGDGAGAIGPAIANAPKLIDAKLKEQKATSDALSATGKFIGARVNDAQKSNQGPAKPKNGAQKSKQRPAKPKSGTGR